MARGQAKSTTHIHSFYIHAISWSTADPRLSFPIKAILLWIIKPAPKQGLESYTTITAIPRLASLFFVPVVASLENGITTRWGWEKLTVEKPAVCSSEHSQALPNHGLENSSSMLQLSLANIRVFIVWEIGFRFLIRLKDQRMHCPPPQQWSFSLETEGNNLVFIRVFQNTPLKHKGYLNHILHCRRSSIRGFLIPNRMM